MNPEIIKESIKELKEEEKRLEERLKLVRMSIEAHRKLCPHTHPDGSSAWITEVGIRYKIEKCEICGLVIDMR